VELETVSQTLDRMFESYRDRHRFTRPLTRFFQTLSQRLDRFGTAMLTKRLLLFRVTPLRGLGNSLQPDEFDL